MGVIRLGVCIGGVYGAFLLWAIAQERLSAPFPSTSPSPSPIHPHKQPSSHQQPKGDKFPTPLFLNYAQALSSSLWALGYLLFSAWREGRLGQGLWKIAGFDLVFPQPSGLAQKTKLEKQQTAEGKQNGHANGTTGPTPPAGGKANGNGHITATVANAKGEGVAGQGQGQGQGDEKLTLATPWRKTLLGLLLQVSLCQSTASPLGFLMLRHISYPTMVLGKSCKLIPVLLLNVLLYRRRFSPHKYLVVALVTLGISLFMLLADSGKKKRGGSDSIWGSGLLGVNLFIDGLTNSTQDQIFSSYPSFTGQQMMFLMSLFTQLLLMPLLLLPLPAHPLSLLSRLPPPFSAGATASASAPLALSPPALLTSLRFLLTHPTALAPLLAYALLGGLGQLFIFETIQHFGSLTLVMVTVTRKLFTMLLSVFVFDHTLTKGQWVGVAVVFGGIGVEAGMKRRDMMRRARRDRK